MKVDEHRVRLNDLYKKLEVLKIKINIDLGEFLEEVADISTAMEVELYNNSEKERGEA